MALSRSGKSVSDLAKWLKRKQPTISQKLNAAKDTDSIRLIEGAAALTGYAFKWLAFGVEEVTDRVSEPPGTYSNGDDGDDCGKELKACHKQLIKCLQEKEATKEQLDELKNFISTTGSKP